MLNGCRGSFDSQQPHSGKMIASETPFGITEILGILCVKYTFLAYLQWTPYLWINKDLWNSHDFCFLLGGFGKLGKSKFMLLWNVSVSDHDILVRNWLTAIDWPIIIVQYYDYSKILTTIFNHGKSFQVFEFVFNVYLKTKHQCASRWRQMIVFMNNSSNSFKHMPHTDSND